MNKSTRTWLEQELPKLIDENVVPNSVADQIRDYYGFDSSARRVPMILMIFGTVGAVLVGLGIILLFAHNWDQLSRPSRTVLSFAPLIVAQALLAFALVKKPGSEAWSESTAVFTVLMVGACIALISQTYQIPGDLGDFLLVWSLLGLPVVYLADARLSGFLYLAAITFWAGFHRIEGDASGGYWILLGLFLPYAFSAYRRGEGLVRLELLSWGIVLSFPVGLALSMGHVIAGGFLVAYPLLFAAMYLFGTDTEYTTTLRWRRAYEWMGTLGTIGWLLVLTYTEVWRAAAADETEWIIDSDPMLLMLDLGPLLALLAATVALLARSWPERSPEALFVVGAPLAVGIAYLLVVFASLKFPATLVTNAYLLGLGVAIVVLGVRAQGIQRINLGLLTIGAWITARFFDVDMSFVGRGVVFIILGAAFLGANLYLIRHMREGADA